jgi:hypothetical protein
MSNIDLVTNLSGLTPFEKYDYYFEGMGGNWPAVVTPVSGSFRPNKNSAKINAVVHFCRTQTSCSGSPSLLNYSTELCDLDSDLFTTVRLRIQPETLPQTLYSDVTTVRCEDCIKKPAVSGFNNVVLNRQDGNEFISSTVFSNLNPNSSYNYRIFSDDANWPVKVTPESGVIKTVGDSVTLSNSIYFCPTSGVCASGDPNVMQYDINNCAKNSYLHASLNVEFYPSDCPEQKTQSDPMNIYCVDCLPRISISMAEFATLQNVNNVTVQAVVSGLNPGSKYNYEFKGIEANWPITLSKPTGSFVPLEDNQLLSTRFTFCPNTGVCEAENRTVIDHELDTYCIFGVRFPFGRINLSVIPESCEIEPAESKPLVIYCSGCLPDMRIFMPSETTLVSNNIMEYSIPISGLRENETYHYEFEGLDSNWPTVIQPQSGEFKLDSDQYTGSLYSLKGRVMFCSPKSICPDGTEGLIDYEFDDYATKKLNQNVLTTKFRLHVSPQNCDFPDKTSDIWNIKCDNCLPCFSYANIDFYDSPELYLESTCCSGNKLITVNVTQANPGDEYKYTFSSTTPEFISFTPSTGLIYFNDTGDGNINTIMTTTLAQNQQGVVNCKLEHVDTGVDMINFLVVRCRGECSI